MATRRQRLAARLIPLWVVGCGLAVEPESAEPDAQVVQPEVELEAPKPEVDAPISTPEPRPEPEPREQLGEPIAHYASTRSLVVRTAPRGDAPLRGAIPRGQAFAVHEKVAGDPTCRKEGWAKVGVDAFACLERAATTDAAPRALPKLPPGLLVPHLYARARNPKADPPPQIPRYRSRRAASAGEVHDYLLPHGTYAFVKRRSGMYIDENRRVVPVEHLRRLEASDFAGRDLVERPPPHKDMTLGWTITRPTPVRAKPDEEAEVLSTIDYHVEIEITTAEPIVHRGQKWIPHAGGFVAATDVRRWTPTAPPPALRAGERWIDVDRTQQILTLYEGETPVFATLVSTGKRGDSTPRGAYRIYKKKALDDMISEPDEEEPYFVESVPWAQFFHEGFALHAAFWHDRFGRANSHGCVNLSPRDAERVFAFSTPELPLGWIAVFEPEVERGTMIQIR